jgi:hypothetical protein
LTRSKADFACCSHEGNAEDIPVHETDVFGSPAYDEEVISSTDQEQTTFDKYPSTDDEEHSFSMVLVYDDYKSSPWESHEGEMEEINVQFISCLDPVNEKISVTTPNVTTTTEEESGIYLFRQEGDDDNS